VTLTVSSLLIASRASSRVVAVLRSMVEMLPSLSVILILPRAAPLPALSSLS
jgi:hypothetical protein